MNRLRFRAWLPRDHEMVYKPLELTFYAEGTWGVSRAGQHWSDLYDAIVMQWTGLTDKNGVEIYEDDLVQNESGRIFKVVWFSSLVTACWDLDVVTPLLGGPPGPYLWAGLNVIGNIHQNPELVTP